MDCRVKETDRISELPLFLLHRILSSLPRKDAATTSVLSKQWNSVWHSFPIFKFEQSHYIKERQGTPGFAEKFGKFLSFVDESLRKFTQNNLRMEVLHLKMDLIDNNSIPMVDTWIPLALHSGVSHICFSFGTIVKGFHVNCYPLPETTFAVKSNPGSSPFYQLQKLDLTKVYLSENIVRDIIRNCPNISVLRLWLFRGLKTLELSKLEKLEKLVIGVSLKVLEIESVSVDAPRLEDFRYMSYERKLPCVIQLTSCRALKRLRLCKCGITDDLFNSYLSRSPLLEYLHLFKCNVLRRIRISAQRLKSLDLYKCEELEVVQIHAPNLSKFTCYTLKNMPVLLSEDVIPCPIEIYHFLCDGPIDSFWFLKLRECLGVSAQGVHFSLYVFENEVSFDPEALRDVAIPPLVNVDLLELNSIKILAQFDCATFIDGLLWSCHPKAISFRDPLCLRNCIKVLCEKVLEREQPLCCKSSHLKCWRHRLKSAKIENFGGIEDDRSLDVNHLLDSLSSLAKGQEVRLRLDWDI